MSTDTIQVDEDLKSKAIKLSYPAKPDGKGSARVNWLRRPYYFGKHNTLESYMLFGEWRRHLIETGEAIEVKVVRRELADLREEINHGEWSEENAALPEEQQGNVPPQRGVRFALLASGIIVLVTFLCAIGKYLSTPTVPMVDGVALTSEEESQIRAMRRNKADLAKIKKDREYIDGDPKRHRLSEMTELIKEVGPERAKQYIKDPDLLRRDLDARYSRLREAQGKQDGGERAGANSDLPRRE